jgi:hypothetical protein
LKLLKDTGLMPGVLNGAMACGALDADEQALRPNAATIVNSANDNDFFMSLPVRRTRKLPWRHLRGLLVELTW